MPEDLPMRAIQCLILVAPLASLAGCGPSLEPLRVRASFDMLCSEQALTLTKIEFDAYTVSGCGRRVNYVYVQEKWIADPTTFGAPFAAPFAAQPPLPMQPAWIGLPTWPPSPLPAPAMPPQPPPPPAAPPPAASTAAPLR
jgi:hypothetical protein